MGIGRCGVGSVVASTALSMSSRDSAAAAMFPGDVLSSLVFGPAFLVACAHSRRCAFRTYLSGMYFSHDGSITGGKLVFSGRSSGTAKMSASKSMSQNRR